MPKYLIFCLLIFFSLFSKAQSNYERIIEFPNNSYKAINIVGSNDDGYVINGSVQIITPALPTSNHLIKFDKFEQIVWSKKYSTSSAVFPFGLINTLKGDIFSVGHTSLDTLGFSGINGFIQKTDSLGNLQWAKIIGGAGSNDALYDLELINDDTLIAIGHTNSYGNGSQDVLCVAINNNNGDTIWTKLFGGGLHDFGFNISKTIDGNLIIVGFTISIGQGSSDILLIKIDYAGNIIWDKSYGTGANETGLGIIRDDFGNFYVLSSSSQFPNGMKLNKMDSFGNLIWSKSYSPSSGYFTADENHNLNFNLNGNIIINALQSPNAGIICEVDTSGNFVWGKYNVSSGNGFRDTYVFNDNSYLSCGEKQINSGAGLHMIHLDSANSCSASPFSVITDNLSLSLDSGLNIKSGVMYNDFLLSESNVSYIDSIICGSLCNLSFSLGSDITICEDSFVSVVGPSGYDYLWNSGDTSQSLNINGNIGDTTLVLQISNGSCFATDTINIISVSSPNIDIVGSQNYCDGDTVNLYATGATTYNWSNLSNNDSIQYIPIVGSEWVSVVGSLNSCSSSDSILIRTNSLPIINTTSDTLVCNGNCVQLNSTGAVSYLWLPISGLSSSTISNPIACPSVTTNYNINGLDSNGCENTSSVLITVNNSPSFSLDIDTTINIGEVILINTGLMCDSIYWSPSSYLSCLDCASQTISPTSNIEYDIKCIDSIGCYSLGIVKINVVSKIINDTIDIPNGFTPNDDGINDVWFILGLDNYPENEVIIFNRWGNQVFQANPYLNNWGGKYNNSELPAGSYYFILKLDKTETIIKGSVNIIK